jgi:sugar lactone lactonase YvrE
MGTTGSVRNVLTVRARLGEGPVWDAATQSLFWVDIYNHRVHRLVPTTGAECIYDVGDVVSAVALGPSDTLLLAQRHHIAWLDLQSGRAEHLQAIEDDRPGNRLNDGKCDANGRFWIGSMAEGEGEGRLYRYDPDGSVHVVETGLTISNGLGWSPDQQTFYLTDSPTKRIYAYSYDAEAGTISDRRVLVDLTAEGFFPDGLAVDEDGCIWSAQWDGECIIRYAPDGTELARIAVPVPRPTSCAFGGADRRDLYITTASVGMSEKEVDRNVSSGDLFCVRTDTAGLLTNRFGGGRPEHRAS